ncbi:MAG TPA: hypothetical protein VN042_10910, partial [Asticcacaulis sp.]|nr:hypothetical protein [Asticcacaulis sp.]
MGQKLPPFEMELYRAVDEVLYYRWDPIGIGDDVWARDEYYGYLPHTFTLLMNESSHPEDIAAYLHKMATVNMGLSAHAIDHDLNIAL